MVKSYNLDEYLECIIDVAFVALATMFAFGPHVFQFFSSEILLVVRLWL